MMTVGIKDAKSLRAETSLLILKDTNKAGVRMGLFESAVIFKNKVVENIMRGPRDGGIDHEYIRRTKRFRRFSVSGESFFNRFGAARRSLGYDVKGSTLMEVGFRKDPKTIYVKVLEEHWNRPTLQIASKETTGTMQTIMIREILKVHDKAAKG